VKTSYDKTGYPAIALLIRRPSGRWDNLHTVDTTGTRGIVVLNEAAEKLMVLYSFTGGTGSGDIVYRETSTRNISFGPMKTILRGSLNNVSSTKQTINDGDVVFVAASTTHSMAGYRMNGSGGSSLASNFTTSSQTIGSSLDDPLDDPAADEFVIL
jgi:hypothetical protein